MNKKLKNHLQYSWIVYVLIAASVIFLWSTVFSAMKAPKDNERISFIFYSDGFDSYSLLCDLNDNKNEITSQRIKDVMIEQFDANKTSLFQRLGTDMMTNDIIVIERSLLDQSEGNRYDVKPEETFYELDTNKLEEYFGGLDVSYLTVNGKAYGIMLNIQNDGVNNTFEKYYKGDKKFILFFSRDSVNVDRMNGLGEEGDSAAIDFVKYLLENE